ncbi:decaprenyl-phosphate phosphoribosyltransferase [Oxobacter pfennigii]|uniref:Decaprenyl-phosphate phosphoribosyltransferase n=1 Tax=Oxobacter pfennigii TaxID=36849 RepID=A0A0P8WMF3_9CLOT|nr:decaprenyl-phosphate phosphoribosyltransferase [Oxobacter pfennigii]KPU43692.1 decaprenyl-phosphate phosphoribosyltransferase [Oxobacter pfennigii]
MNLKYIHVEEKVNIINEVFKLCRIKQWIKNGFVAAAIIFSGNFFNIKLLFSTFLTFFMFSFISSCVYILNDIVDVNEDKRHPEKRKRPIAKGTISVSVAIVILLCLFISSIVFSYFINVRLTVILIIYFLINIAYSFKLKNIMIVDVMTIAIGFILRVVSGAIVIDVRLSYWLLICTALVSLYLGFAKRKNELIVMREKAGIHRTILSKYTIEYLDKILIIVMTLTIITYALYVINGTDYKGMILTVPFVLYGTFRYEYLIMNKNFGGSPEDIFIEDKPFLINIIAWVIVSVISIYFVKM